MHLEEKVHILNSKPQLPQAAMADLNFFFRTVCGNGQTATEVKPRNTHNITYVTVVVSA